MSEIEQESVVSSHSMYLTPSGFERLQKELHTLTQVKRAEIAERLRECKEHGEFSEDNNELDEIKFEQAMVESRITELKAMFAGAQVIDIDQLDTDSASVGNTVEVSDPERNIEFEVRLVSSIEADPDNDLVSIESPMGLALLGSKVGESVTFEAPAGEITYKVISIGK